MGSPYRKDIGSGKVGGQPWVGISRWYQFGEFLWGLVRQPWAWIKRTEPGVRVTVHPSGEQFPARWLPGNREAVIAYAETHDPQTLLQHFDSEEGQFVRQAVLSFLRAESAGCPTV